MERQRDSRRLQACALVAAALVPLLAASAFRQPASWTVNGSPNRSRSQPAALTAAQWKEDLQYLVATVKAVHPAPFHRVPEAEMDRAVATLSREIPRLSDRQIVVRMMGIVALLNDGHSGVIPAPVFKMDHSYPIRLDRFADGIYIVAARPDMQSIIGAHVTMIGIRSAASVWDSISVVASGDNVYSRWGNVPLLLTAPETMEGLGLSRADSLVLTVVRADGTTTRVAVAAVAAPFDMQWVSAGWDGPAGAVAHLNTTSLVEQHRRAPYWFAQVGGMLYAQINQVNDSRDTVPLGADRAVVTLDGLAQRLLERVEAGGADRLVLDLRFNGGGNNRLTRSFVQRLSASTAINQKGHLFVITGRRTYSAAMNFTSLLEDRTAALFVGEPPGGTPSHYGDATGFTLPQSKMTFRVSTLHWDIGVQPSDVREAMEPDLPAPPTYAQLRAGTDAPLDAIARYRDGDRLSDRLLARYQQAGLDSAMALYDAQRASPVVEAPWRSDVQQLLKFVDGVISRATTRAVIFRALTFVTERYPDSPEAWFELARVHAFVGDWPEVLRAYSRARRLRPQNDLIRRGFEAARRR